jgi:hypothetical protein
MQGLALLSLSDEQFKKRAYYDGSDYILLISRWDVYWIPGSRLTTYGRMSSRKQDIIIYLNIRYSNVEPGYTVFIDYCSLIRIFGGWGSDAHE